MWGWRQSRYAALRCVAPAHCDSRITHQNSEQVRELHRGAVYGRRVPPLYDSHKSMFINKYNLNEVYRLYISVGRNTRPAAVALVGFTVRRKGSVVHLQRQRAMILGVFLLVCVSAARGRDAARPLRTVPAVTNSLINLGKMDIAFYINGKPQDIKPEHAGPFLSSTSDAVEEPCPCSGLKYFKDSSRSHPSDILRKLLHSNDLFSYREPSVSTLCCDSHEQVREDSIIFEFGPKQRQVAASPLPSSRLPTPLLLDGLLPSGRLTNSLSPIKQNLVELFLFPKKSEIALDLGKTIKKNSINKDDIKIVGDKEVRNDFKTMKLLPPQPQSPPSSSSVKKDLTVQHNKTKQGDNKPDEIKSISNSNLI